MDEVGENHARKRGRIPTSSPFVRIIPYDEGKGEDPQITRLSGQEPRDSNGQHSQPTCEELRSLLNNPRDAQRAKEGRKDGLSCRLKRLCLVD
jgi:hypothetical protein